MGHSAVAFQRLWTVKGNSEVRFQPLLGARVPRRKVAMEGAGGQGFADQPDGIGAHPLQRAGRAIIAPTHGSRLWR